MAVPIVYTNFVAPAIDAGNLNTVNSVVYTLLGNGTDAPASVSDIRNNLGLGNTAGPVPVLNGGTGDSGTAWSTQAINIAASAGALANANASIRWKIIGKTVFFSATGNVIANGTGSGNIMLSALPFTFANFLQVFVGRETAASGHSLTGTSSGSNSLSVFKYDNTYPAANNTILVLTGVGELA